MKFKDIENGQLFYSIKPIIGICRTQFVKIRPFKRSSVSYPNSLIIIDFGAGYVFEIFHPEEEVYLE